MPVKHVYLKDGQFILAGCDSLLTDKILEGAKIQHLREDRGWTVLYLDNGFVVQVPSLLIIHPTKGE